MNEMTDVELSLAVAKIIWPEYKWKVSMFYGDHRPVGRDEDGIFKREFEHTTDDALGKMCIWLHRGVASDNGSRAMRVSMLRMAESLLDNNPHRAIAEAVVEAAEDA